GGPRTTAPWTVEPVKPSTTVSTPWALFALDLGIRGPTFHIPYIHPLSSRPWTDGLRLSLIFSFPIPTVHYAKPYPQREVRQRQKGWMFPNSLAGRGIRIHSPHQRTRTADDIHRR
ncbi:hypothetical protein JMJ77_0003961, partial [Colletotrichum scovillei]